MKIHLNRIDLDVLYLLLLGSLLSSCGFITSESDLSEQLIQEGVQCVYNQAYQENYKTDGIDLILKEARDCYVLVDPFSEIAVADAIPLIQTQGNSVGCYLSVGTGETWRDDFSLLEPDLVKDAWAEWNDEYFIREITPEVVAVMQDRIKKLADWGCDWVEFDNMDWTFDESSRLEYQIEATEADAVLYYQRLCETVHQSGMLCMAKSTRVGTADFDGITVESSRRNRNWWGKETLQTFLDEEKLTIIVHYKEFFCDDVYKDYQLQYDGAVSFICEDRLLRAYRHFNW